MNSCWVKVTVPSHRAPRLEEQCEGHWSAGLCPGLLRLHLPFFEKSCVIGKFVVFKTSDE